MSSCTLCNEKCSNFGVGPCNHHVCGKCAIRIRIVCKSKECPICRSLIDRICLINKPLPYNNIEESSMLYDHEHEILFETRELQAYFLELTAPRCKECDKREYSMSALNRHVNNKHSKLYCDLCMQNLKLFPFEFKLYAQEELAAHRKWNPSDPTHGHPMCEFCQRRFFDVDIWYSHLRREHFMCHICENRPDRERYSQSRVVYGSYQDLLAHFRGEHFVCDEGACLEAQFTNVFATEAERKAHRLLVHTMSRADRREAQRLDVDITFNRANGRGRGRGVRGRGRGRFDGDRDEQNDSPCGKRQPPAGLQGRELVADPDSKEARGVLRNESYHEDPEEFPGLGTGDTSAFQNRDSTAGDPDSQTETTFTFSGERVANSAQVVALAARQSAGRLVPEDFPSLGDSAPQSVMPWRPSAYTAPSTNPRRPAKPTPATDNRQEDFPQLGGGVAQPSAWVQPVSARGRGASRGRGRGKTPAPPPLSTAEYDFPSLPNNVTVYRKHQNLPENVSNKKDKQKQKSSSPVAPVVQTVTDSLAGIAADLCPPESCLSTVPPPPPAPPAPVDNRPAAAPPAPAPVDNRPAAAPPASAPVDNRPAAAPLPTPPVEDSWPTLGSPSPSDTTSWSTVPSHTSRSGVTNGNITKKLQLRSEEDFPSMGNAAGSQPLWMTTSNKTSTKTKYPPKPKSKVAPSPFATDQYDFPTLSEQFPNKSKFSSKKQPMQQQIQPPVQPTVQPPVQQQVHHKPASFTPKDFPTLSSPTATEMVAYASPALSLKDLSAELLGATFHPVVDQEARDSRLIQELQDRLHEDDFMSFGVASSSYRRRESSAEEYVAAVEPLLNGLGEHACDLWLELVTLLPDIPAQRNLLAALPFHHSARKLLQECPRCSQVLSRSELPEHQTMAHSL